MADRGLVHDPGRPRARQQCRGHPGRDPARRQRRLPTTADQLLALAARLEGHPDNVAAALYGGFTLAVMDSRDVTVRRFRVPEAWIPVLFIAQAESHTEDMRAALPAGS